MSRKTGNGTGGESHYDTSVVLSRFCPQLYSIIARDSEDFLSLSIRQRGLQDFVAVLKRVGSDGQAEVIFSNGFDFVSCLLSMEGSVAAGRWKVDVPWDERSKK